MFRKSQSGFFLLVASILIFNSPIAGQPEWRPWGNMKGIRIDGELIPFETSLRFINSNWTGYTSTEKYNWEGNQTYNVFQNKREVFHKLLNLPVSFSTIMVDEGRGLARQTFKVSAESSAEGSGLYYCIEFPYQVLQSGEIQFLSNGKKASSLFLSENNKAGNQAIDSRVADQVLINTKTRTWKINIDKARTVILKKQFISTPHHVNDPWPTQQFAITSSLQKTADYQLYIEIRNGSLTPGFSDSLSVQIECTSTNKPGPVSIRLNPELPGRSFDGISGNYRWQFPDKDPAVIDYLLDSLRVTWGRINFSWNEWQPGENTNPVQKAESGSLSANFYKQQELAKKLAARGIPVIVSVWWAPEWAIDRNRPAPKGYFLDTNKLDKIQESISSYLFWLKRTYGVEARLFSFNEPDYGVDVRHTAKDHEVLYRSIGLHFASVGLPTKMLLADTGACTDYALSLLDSVKKDPDLHRFAGAIAFHSYHGNTNDDLKKWVAVAKLVNLPLMLTEGGTNSAAHRYPMVFLEPWFQLDEIDMYIRTGNIAQPQTLMPWQLTSDYSVLTGNGLYNDHGPLRPTQRFWNLRQLGSSPAGSFWIPAESSDSTVTVAANASLSKQIWTIHLVNSGPERPIQLAGLPAEVTSLQVFVTTAEKGMEPLKPVIIRNGKAEFSIPALSYCTLQSSGQPGK